jgi:hypothetical protein
MRKAVDLAKKIYKDPEANWLSHLEEQNLHTIFRPVYHHNFTIEIQNKIVAFVILAYDNDSPWIDVKKDRYQNKLSILDGIDVDKKSPVFKAILNYEDDKIQEVILNYLIAQTDHRWYEVMTLLEYSNKTMMFCNRRTNDKVKTGSSLNNETKELENDYEFLDPREIAAVNKEKGDLIKKAMEARKTADDLLKTMESDFQKTDAATQGDFGFQFSDPKKFDVTSWEQRLRKRKAEQSEK